MFVGDWLCEQTDDDSNDEDDHKQDNSEMEIMDVFYDGRPDVLGLVTARESSVGALPDESDYADQQTRHQSPERTLQ